MIKYFKEGLTPEEMNLAWTALIGLSKSPAGQLQSTSVGTMFPLMNSCNHE